jgi:hypothetical protein
MRFIESQASKQGILRKARSPCTASDAAADNRGRTEGQAAAGHILAAVPSPGTEIVTQGFRAWKDQAGIAAAQSSGICLLICTSVRKLALHAWDFSSISKMLMWHSICFPLYDRSAINELIQFSLNYNPGKS